MPTFATIRPTSDAERPSEIDRSGWWDVLVRVKDEVAFARRIFADQGWPVWDLRQAQLPGVPVQPGWPLSVPDMYWPSENG